MQLRAVAGKPDVASILAQQGAATPQEREQPLVHGRVTLARVSGRHRGARLATHNNGAGTAVAATATVAAVSCTAAILWATHSIHGYRVDARGSKGKRTGRGIHAWHDKSKAGELLLVQHAPRGVNNRPLPVVQQAVRPQRPRIHSLSRTGLHRVQVDAAQAQ